MTSSAGRRPAGAACALTCLGGAAVLAAYVATWIIGIPSHYASMDFTNTFVAGDLLHQGARGSLYDMSAQLAEFARVSPRAPEFLPFLSTPPAALVGFLLSPLGLLGSYTLFGAIQAGLVAAAAVIAIRATPEARSRPLPESAAIVLLVVAGFGSMNLIANGNWSGLNAFGLAMAYSAWRRGHWASGGAWLTSTALFSKPHLALPLFCFMLGWHHRRVLAGALMAGCAFGITSLAVVGFDGLGPFLRAETTNSHQWGLVGMSSFVSLPAAWFKDGSATYVVAFGAMLVMTALAAWLGTRVAAGRCSLSRGLATAAALSLLAAPHAYAYDTVVLAPAVAWTLVELDLFHPRKSPTLPTTALLVAILWLGASSLSHLVALAAPGYLAIGNPDTWMLVLLCAALWRNAVPTWSPLPALRTTLSRGQAVATS